jgi:hypothetical protein
MDGLPSTTEVRYSTGESFAIDLETVILCGATAIFSPGDKIANLCDP